MFPKAEALPLRQGSGGGLDKLHPPESFSSKPHFTEAQCPQHSSRLPPQYRLVGYFCLSVLGLVLISLILLGPLGLCFPR